MGLAKFFDKCDSDPFYFLLLIGICLLIMIVIMIAIFFVLAVIEGRIKGVNLKIILLCWKKELKQVKQGGRNE